MESVSLKNKGDKISSYLIDNLILKTNKIKVLR